MDLFQNRSRANNQLLNDARAFQPGHSCHTALSSLVTVHDQMMVINTCAEFDSSSPPFQGHVVVRLH
jgi:hypothetical protein